MKIQCFPGQNVNAQNIFYWCYILHFWNNFHICASACILCEARSLCTPGLRLFVLWVCVCACKNTIPKIVAYNLAGFWFRFHQFGHSFYFHLFSIRMETQQRLWAFDVCLYTARWMLVILFLFMFSCFYVYKILPCASV